MKRYPVKRPLMPEVSNRLFQKVDPNQVSVIPPLEDLFNDVEAIIGVEYARIKQKMANQQELDNKDVNSLTKCGELLLKLSKERREREKESDQDNLSDEELLEQAELAVKELRAKIAEKNKSKEGANES